MEFHSITEKVDTSTAQGKFFLTIIGAMAQMERDLIGERTKEALRYKKSKLEVYSPVPFGFDKQDGHIKPNKQELRVVALMKKLRRRELSYQGIVNYLSRENIPTKKGRSWSKSTVCGILRNPIYSNLNLTW